MRILERSMFLVILGIASLPAIGQGGDLPPSFSDPLVLPLSSVDLERIPAVNSAAQAAAEAGVPDEWRSEPFALSQKAGFSTTTSGTWETLSTGGQIWRLRVQALGAVWMTAGFGTFRVPAGAKMWVYDTALGQLQGPFGSDDVLDRGQRWFHPMDGDTFVVELFWPTALTGITPNIHLTRAEVGFRPLFPLDDDCDGDCNPDITCPQGFDVSVIKRGMIRLTMALGPWPYPCGEGIEQCDDQCAQTGECFLPASANCSGTLINTTANDCRQYVLTAGHCVEDQGAAQGSKFLFNYERETCCEGPLPTKFWVTNAEVLAEWDGVATDSDGGDMALVRIEDDIPQEHNARFNGWSRGNTPANGFAPSVHQPSGAASKKISYALGGYVEHNSRFWRVDNWTVGAPRDGSSGSPLFNSGLRVVGHLSTGPIPAPCPGVNDKYGRFDRCWTGGNSNASRLRNWLDPASTDMISYHGRDDGLFASCVLSPWPQAFDSGGMGGGGNPAGPGESVILTVPLQNQGSSTLTDVAGTLRSTTPGVTVVQDQATWPDISGFGSSGNNPPHFVAQVNASVGCGGKVDFELDVTSDDGDGAWHPELSMRLGQETVTNLSGFDVFTSASLAGTNAWTLDSTDDTPIGPRWFIADIATLSDTVLVSAPIAALPADARLKFRHKSDTENTYDGGVLEYSVDGTNWLDAEPLIVSGRYTSGLGGGVPSDIRGRDVWGGDSGGWRDVEVDLSGLGGQPFQLRFRFVTDTSDGDVGWWIDDAVIETTTYSCATPSPPAVPDGSHGSPMLVDRLNPDGSALRIFYDDATCLGAADRHIVFGHGSQLPGSLTGTYSLSGSVCGVGTVSPFDWTGAPDPTTDPSRLLWWLLLANDRIATEGSWSENSGDVERSGPASGGASGECGMVLKNTANACGL